MLIWKIKKKKKEEEEEEEEENDVTLGNHLLASSENKHCVRQMLFKLWTFLNIMVV